MKSVAFDRRCHRRCHRRWRAAALVAVALTCGGGAFADDCPVAAPSAASGPTPYPPDAAAWPGRGFTRAFGWMEGNRKSFWRRRAEDRCSVVFVGDSLVGQWATLKQDFAPLKVANRGIGGDGSRGVLFRFDEDVLDLSPRAVVVLVGTNDLSAKQSVADIVSNLRDMLKLANDRDPSMPMIFCTLPPRDDPHAPIDREQLLAFNSELQALAAGKRRVAVVDLYKALTAADGGLDPRFFKPDHLHMNADAYVRVHESVQPALDKLGVR